MMDGGARLDPARLFRFHLWRTWDPALKRVLFVMLNPSKADESKNDPTITKCLGFAKAIGFGRIDVANMYPHRATDPDDCAKLIKTCGEEWRRVNDLYIIALADRADRVIVAWGGEADRAWCRGRDGEVMALLDGRYLECLGRTKSGQPRHPLMLAYKTKLEVYRGKVEA
jgi:hypothetical protein